MDIKRRELVIGLVLGAASLGGGVGRTSARLPSPVPPTRRPSQADKISYVINGESITRAQVLEWEHKRLNVVWQKLKPFAVSPASSQLDARNPATTPTENDLAQMREDLLHLKLQIGTKRLKELLATELRRSGLLTRILTATSFDRYVLSVTDIQCTQGSAEEFVEWFSGRVKANDQRAMLVACPDHYVLETLSNGNQYVLETTGGSPLASQFEIDFNNSNGNPVVLTSELPVRLSGMALDGVRTVGFACHQFGKRTGGGFRGRLTIAFPRSTPSRMTNEHSWHLACEFSNWIEAYLCTTP